MKNVRELRDKFEKEIPELVKLQDKTTARLNFIEGAVYALTELLEEEKDVTNG